MKKIFVAVALIAYGAVAFAACPQWSPYNCKPGPNGKQICGCGV